MDARCEDDEINRALESLDALLWLGADPEIRAILSKPLPAAPAAPQQPDQSAITCRPHGNRKSGRRTVH